MKTFIPFLIGLALLTTFLGVILYRVAAIPLIVICVSIVAMVIYDFWLDMRGGHNGNGR